MSMILVCDNLFIVHLNRKYKTDTGMLQIS